MTLPFTVDQFLAVFIAYNSAIWPMQVFLNLAGISAAGLCFRRSVPFRLDNSCQAYAGAGFIFYGLVGYPREFVAYITIDGVADTLVVPGDKRCGSIA